MVSAPVLVAHHADAAEAPAAIEAQVQQDDAAVAPEGVEKAPEAPAAEI